MQFTKYLSVMWILSFGYGAALAQSEVWQQTNGPEGATVNMIAVNKANGYIFAVISGVGMMRSTDDGESWVLKNTGLENTSVQAIAINADGVIFAGTNGQGVFRSIDQGESWVQVNTGIAATHRNIRALAVDSQTDSLFAGTSSSGLYRSSNNGNTWTPLPTGLTGAVTIQALAIKHGSGVVFAGTDSRGGLRSFDNGNTWTPTDTSTIYKSIRALVVTASGAVFAGADSASTKRAILRSTDNGESWTRVFEPSSSVVWFALNVSDHIWAGTGGSGVYLSSDGGDNWTPRNDGLRGYGIKVLALNASDHIFAGAHCSGIFRSTDNGASWQAMNHGLRYTEILSLAVSPTTGMIVAGSHCGGVFRSSDYGDNWEWAGLPGAQVTALAVNASGRFFAGVARVYLLGTSGDIYYADDGITWRRVTPDDDAYFSFATCPNGQIYAGTGFYHFFSDYGDIYRSTNNGASWSRVASSLDDFVYALACAPNDRVFAGTAEGVYRSRNEYWDKLNSYNTRSVIIAPTNPNIVIIGTSGGIWRSADGGDSWALVRSMSNNFTWALIALPTGEIFAGTQRSGVLKSTDAGLTWTSINAALPNNDVRSLAIHHASGKIFAGTNGTGVFRGELSPPPPAAPVLAAPANGASDQPTEVNLAWQASPGATSYRLQVASDSLFATTIFDDSTITDTSQRIGPLAHGATHYWRLNARNAAGTSAWSSTWHFATISDTATVTPQVAATQTIGAEFWVDIAISNVQNLLGLSFELNYSNTAYVDVVTPHSGNVIPGNFLGNDVVFVQNVDEANGKVSIGITRKDGQGGVSGSGVVARVKFKSLTNTPSGTLVEFCVDQVSANDPAGATIPLAARCDTTTIQGLLVWPGDTNNDGIVNQNDVLPLGQHWSRTGPVRQPASTAWQAQPATPWNPKAATYADANGDSVVNQNDVLVIGLNWGKTHGLTTMLADKGNTTSRTFGKTDGAAIYYTLPGGNPLPGQEFWVEISLQDVINLFGLAFEVVYSPAAEIEPVVEEAGDFLGSEVIFYPHRETSAGRISIAITRKAPQPGVNGSGIVARIKLRMSSNAPAGQIVAMSLQNVTGNDPAGNTIAIGVTTGVEEAAQAGTRPEHFALHPNTPNPFNPSTTLRYDLPRQVEVKLTIFDITGRHVRTLVDQTQGAGRYAVIWDSRNEQGQPVASGTFFYQLRAGNFVQTLRMALVR